MVPAWPTTVVGGNPASAIDIDASPSRPAAAPRPEPSTTAMSNPPPRCSPMSSALRAAPAQGSVGTGRYGAGTGPEDDDGSGGVTTEIVARTRPEPSRSY